MGNAARVGLRVTCGAHTRLLPATYRRSPACRRQLAREHTTLSLAWELVDEDSMLARWGDMLRPVGIDPDWWYGSLTHPPTRFGRKE